MNAEDMVYWLYVIAATGLVVGTLHRFRSILHPHTVVTAIVVVMFMSDFIVRGYSDESLSNIPGWDLIYYQIVILAVCVVILGGLHLVLPVSSNNHGIRALTLFDARNLRYFHVAAWGLLILELLKRLYSAGWSWQMAVSASLGAYGSWPWESAYGNLGDETFVYSLIGMLLPASGLAFAYFVQTGRGQRRAWAIIGYVAVLALLAADGKRTPALFVLAGHGVFYLTGTRSALRKILVLSAIAIVGVALASAMYLFRVGGMGQVISGDSEGYELVYHQDDSYYKSVRALHIAGSSNERWDPVVFLYTTVVNPVPRFLWPNKPALLQEYWGEYKDYWVTISFVGELVAMFGPVVGVILSIIVAWGLFALLRRTFLLTVEPGGIIVYLAVALYCYMVMRSLLNITQFIYLPAFTYLIFLAQRRGFVRHAVALS